MRFFDVDHPSSPARLSRGGVNQIGLPGQESRDLHDIADLGRGGGLVGLVDIGCHGKAAFLANTIENRQSFIQPRTSETVDARAVGLIKARFEDDRNILAGGNVGERG